MKTYDEIITFMVNDTEGAKQLRYSEWAAILVISEIYGKPYSHIKNDIDEILKKNEVDRKTGRKAQVKLENYQRHLANLSKGNSISG